MSLVVAGNVWASPQAAQQVSAATFRDRGSPPISLSGHCQTYDPVVEVERVCACRVDPVYAGIDLNYVSKASINNLVYKQSSQYNIALKLYGRIE